MMCVCVVQACFSTLIDFLVDAYQRADAYPGHHTNKPEPYKALAKKKLLAGQLEPASVVQAFFQNSLYGFSKHGATVAMCLEVGEGWHGPAI